ncbi:hypothetical protein S140_177 [Shewanella sp. phage 1/40]|uniref:hypothetical protein n=1 Tax=Shewanella sp. phage 1/40 TaxID=1458860 RepID=UPI0004F841E6|nr:hypothetical protein S140_177 [Shewanella sp. phage 1/40]AHK11584.1 hypothetical protein S140_177 [Shewanella sp. phage 1/40]
MMSLEKMECGVNYTTETIRTNINGLIDQKVSGIKSLGSLTAYDGMNVNVNGFYVDTLVGGGNFVYDASKDKADHNGGTVIAPEAIAAWDGTQGNLASLLSWTGTGAGCFVRVFDGGLFPSFFGADTVKIGKPMTDSKLSFSAASAACFSEKNANLLLDGNININSSVKIPIGVNLDLNGFTLYISGASSNYTNRCAILINTDDGVTQKDGQNLATIPNNTVVNGFIRNEVDDNLNLMKVIKSFCHIKINALSCRYVGCLLETGAVYADHIVVDTVYGYSSTVANPAWQTSPLFFIDLQGLADSVVLNSVHVVPHTNPWDVSSDGQIINSIRIKKQGDIFGTYGSGGTQSITNCLNGVFKFEECDNLNIDNCYFEGGSVYLKSCTANISNSRFRFQGVNTIVVEQSQFQYAPTVLSLDNVAFKWDVTDASEQRPQVNDIKMHRDTVLVIDNCFREVTYTGFLGAQIGIRVAKLDETPIEGWAGRANWLSKRSTVENYLVDPEDIIVKYRSTWGGPFQMSPQVSSNSTLANGTYYYKFALLHSTSPLIGCLDATERSCIVTSSNKVPMAFFAPTASTLGVNTTTNSAVIRVYRGVTSGMYDYYVDVPYNTITFFQDAGFEAMGLPWVPRSTGQADSVLEMFTGTFRILSDRQGVYIYDPSTINYRWAYNFNADNDYLLCSQRLINVDDGFDVGWTQDAIAVTDETPRSIMSQCASETVTDREFSIRWLGVSSGKILQVRVGGVSIAPSGIVDDAGIWRVRYSSGQLFIMKNGFVISTTTVAIGTAREPMAQFAVGSRLSSQSDQFVGYLYDIYVNGNTYKLNNPLSNSQYANGDSESSPSKPYFTGVGLVTSRWGKV